MKRSRLLSTAIPLAALWALFMKVVRPWYLHWGATPEEVRRSLPMDDHVPAPTLLSTMAVSINAPPERVWPWLVQMGDPPRAGYYSYTWIERLVGLEISNRDEILPELQTVRVGEALDRNGTMCVLAVEPGEHLVLGPPETVAAVRCTWAFALFPRMDGGTRLVTRVRGKMNWTVMLREASPLTWPFYLLIEPGAFVMERKMLREIKCLAEGSASAGA